MILQLIEIVLQIALSILWLALFIKHQREGTLQFTNLLLLIIAIGLLPLSLYKLFILAL
ncbi:hypothetical protein [Metabacillus litoralis]|uniref:hypothetical protein n=1 Tax=Metabacillus litoralis TaxID=152268 RepID=UPI00203CD56F|nr:hypothetical protein [Metabacillus litoralis]MCM3413154.1 hypothetical protein [Metabacillus litoralis]